MKLMGMHILEIELKPTLAHVTQKRSLCVGAVGRC